MEIIGKIKSFSGCLFTSTYTEIEIVNSIESKVFYFTGNDADVNHKKVWKQIIENVFTIFMKYSDVKATYNDEGQLLNIEIIE